MKDKLKQPIANRIMAYWHSLDPEIRFSVFYITSLLLTIIEQLLNGASLRDALLVFVSALLTQINAMKAIDSVAEKNIKEADSRKDLPTGIN